MRLIRALQRYPERHIVALQETHQDSTRCELDDLQRSGYYVFRADHRSNSRGVAVVFATQMVKPGTVPRVVHRAADGRCIIVEFDDKCDNHLCVASLYLPSDAAQSRVSHLAALPWTLLAKCIIGTDSNLYTCAADNAEGTATVGIDGNAFIDHLGRHDLVDLWDASDAAALAGTAHGPPPVHRDMTFYRGDSAKTCIDRIIMPTHLLDTVDRFGVEPSDGRLSDHCTIEAVLRRFAPAPSARAPVPARMRTQHAKIHEVAKQCRETRDVLLGIYQNELLLNVAPPPIEYYSSVLKYISEVLADVHRDTLHCAVRARKRTWERKIRHNYTKARALAYTVANQARRKQLHEANAALFNKFKTAHADEARRQKAEKKRRRLQTTLAIKRLFSKHCQKQSIDIIEKPDGNFSCEDADIVDEMTGRWQTILNPPDITTNEAAVRKVLACVPRTPSLAAVSMDLTLDDLKDALKNMAKDKSPGPDRTTAQLFVDMPFLLEDVLRVWQARKEHGIPKQWRTAWLAPVHKKGPRSKPLNYRLISLLCVSYKLCTSAVNKKLITALKPVLNPEQQAFVPGRDIRNSVWQVLACADDAAEHQQKLAVLFFDFRKAYDTCSREFILWLLQAYGFSDDFVADAQRLLNERVSRYIVNGRLSAEFWSTVGLPQGDALSCTFYILMVSPLPELARRNGVRGYNPHGFEESLRLICVQYVDDLTGFARDAADVQGWRRTLKDFGDATRQVEEPTKVRVTVPFGDAEADFAMSNTNWNGAHQIVVDRLRYLGFQLDKHCRIHASTFTQVQSRVALLAKQWSTRDRLSMKERAVVLQAAVTAQATFVARVTPMPPAVSKAIESVAWKTFMFRGALCHPAKEVAQRPAVAGGITRRGLGSLPDRFTALLAKGFTQYAAKRQTDRINTWYHDKAARDQEAGGIPHNLTNGPAVVGSNPGAWVKAAAADCQLICTGFDSADKLMQDDIDAQPLFGNALISRALKPDDVCQQGNLTHVRDLFNAGRKLKPIFDEQHPVIKAIKLANAQLGVDWLDVPANRQLTPACLATNSLVTKMQIVPRGNNREVTFPWVARVVTGVQAPATGSVCIVPLQNAVLDQRMPAEQIALAPREEPAAGLIRAYVDSAGFVRTRANQTLDPKLVGLIHERPGVADAMHPLFEAVTEGRQGAGRQLRRDHMQLAVDTNRQKMRETRLPRGLQHRRFVPLRDIKTRHLVRRLAALHYKHAPVKPATAFSFADVQRKRVFTLAEQDFLWRVMLRKLPFGEQLLGEATMHFCPLCGVATNLLPNDHIITDCTSRAMPLLDLLKPVVRRALPAVNNTAALLKKAWQWQLVPEPRNPQHLLVFMVVLAAKRLLWKTFTAWHFGTSEAIPPATTLCRRVQVQLWTRVCHEQSLVRQKEARLLLHCAPADAMAEIDALRAKGMACLAWWAAGNIRPPA